jgi:hypothetical protein
MATLHLRAQSLECPELKLFDGAFRFAQTVSDFPDRALLDKALADDLALNCGKVIHETEKAGMVVDGFQVRRGKVRMGAWILRVDRGWILAGRPLVLIGERVGSDTEKPGSERSAAPFVLGKIGESFVKHF